jgi:hypothetical protein
MKKPLTIGIIALLLVGLGYLVYIKLKKATATAAAASPDTDSKKTGAGPYYVNSDGTVDFSRDASGKPKPFGGGKITLADGTIVQV